MKGLRGSGALAAITLIDVAQPLHLQFGGTERLSAITTSSGSRQAWIARLPGLAIHETLHIFGAERRNIVAQVRQEPVE